MSKTRILLRVAGLGLAAVLFAAPAPAEEISASHIAAARETIAAVKSARGFDDLLPVLSQQVQNQLIRARPDLYSQISDAVNAMALTLVARRTDLDNDVARIWAKTFTEDELKAITVFYKSPVGAKFLDNGPKAFADSLQVAKGWSDRVREELLEKSREELKKRKIEF